MKNCGIRYAASACTFAIALISSGVASAQTTPSQPTTQTILANDAGKLSDKFTGLARVMAAKYDWKPAPGVRSVGEVLNLIVAENGMLAGLMSGAPPQGRPAPISDPAQLQEALHTSYANLQKAISGLSDSDLNASVKMFGRDTTKQAALAMLLADQHEHLGQSIAYARMNGVVPPWSK